MQFSIRFEGNAAKVLRDAAKRMSDMRPMMGEIAAEMHDQTLARFAAEKGPDGVPWQRSKRAEADGGKTLQHKGYLIDAVAPDFNDREAIVGVEGGGSAAKYAAVHQFGFAGAVQVPAHQRVIRHAFGKPLANPVTVTVGPFQRMMNMPARPYLGFSDDDKVTIEGILSTHLKRAFEGGAA